MVGGETKKTSENKPWRLFTNSSIRSRDYFKIPELLSMYLRRGFTLVCIYVFVYVFVDLAESAAPG